MTDEQSELMAQLETAVRSLRLAIIRGERFKALRAVALVAKTLGVINLTLVEHGN